MNFYLDAVKQLGESNSEAKRLAQKYLLKDIEIGKSKENGIDRWDSNKSMKGKIIPGTIISFYYKKTILPNKISIGDSYPILLCLKSSMPIFSGINFNYCSKEERSCIINELCNIDESFFQKGYRDNIKNNAPVVSPKVLSFFSKEGSSSLFLDEVKRKYKIKSIAYNTYKIENVRSCNIVELWAWPYIPFFEQSILKEFSLSRVKELIKNK